MNLTEGLLPGLLAMALPTAISVSLLLRLQKLRRAAAWPVATGRITQSALQSEKLSNGSVRNRPAVTFEYLVGGKHYQGSRVHVVDRAGSAGKPDEALALYPVGAAVPVCYNPADPSEAALERNPPLSMGAMYVVVGGIFLAGVGAALLFGNLERVMAGLEAVFPPNAAPQAFIFFCACGTRHALGDLQQHPRRTARQGLADRLGHRRREPRRLVSRPHGQRQERGPRTVLPAADRVRLRGGTTGVPQHSGALRRGGLERVGAMGAGSGRALPEGRGGGRPLRPEGREPRSARDRSRLPGPELGHRRGLLRLGRLVLWPGTVRRRSPLEATSSERERDSHSRGAEGESAGRGAAPAIE